MRFFLKTLCKAKNGCLNEVLIVWHLLKLFFIVRQMKDKVSLFKFQPVKNLLTGALKMLTRI